MPRQRLLLRLDEGTRRPLTLIIAPAGYGKSTLASRWARVRGAACGWISLGAEDNDLQQFLYYVLAATEPVLPQGALQTESLLEAQSLPPVGTLTRSLLNDLNKLKEPFCLVLDDYHCITDHRVHDLVAGLMDFPAKALHLVILSRKDPPLSVAGMRARGLVNEIRGDELRLTPQEVRLFLKQMGQLSVDDATAAILEEKIEGWPAGLRLTGLYLKEQKDPKSKAEILSGSSVHIADYLFAEVLSRLSPDMVSVLLSTAILDRFCAPLCQTLHDKQKEPAPCTRAEGFIRWLTQQNLFIVGLDDRGYWFRYHHLFQDFLRKELNRKRSAEQVAELHCVVGEWFSNAEILRQATSVNAEVLALSGPRNPYPGKLGVIEEGALADILLINGNPLENIRILTRPEEHLALIMKDGKIYKNTIE